MNIHWGAVLVSAIVGQVIGMLWYSHGFFGTAWVRSIGWNPDDKEFLNKMKKHAPQAMAVGFVMTVIMAYVQAYFMNRLGITSMNENIKLALWLWFGFVATVILLNIMYEVRSKKLFIINAGYILVVMLATAVILAAWK